MEPTYLFSGGDQLAHFFSLSFKVLESTEMKKPDVKKQNHNDILRNLTNAGVFLKFFKSALGRAKTKKRNAAEPIGAHYTTLTEKHSLTANLFVALLREVPDATCQKEQTQGRDPRTQHREKWPVGEMKRPIIVQQDNATPHVLVSDPDIVAAGTEAIQSLQYEHNVLTTEMLIEAVVQSFKDLDSNKLKSIFLTLQQVMEG
uniref:AlNc14C354G10935 protein n=1 Tax=Albugo laibachii Nc14 TaxID=890382 RepID=F0WXI4_9STRA|nr:AlNc14C354G10935 [Albugo laibachii Nc14]|eukprot:CCA26178.1 AlNc14C354G10935 [Albugo laibachii Nc14]